MSDFVRFVLFGMILLLAALVVVFNAYVMVYIMVAGR